MTTSSDRGPITLADLVGRDTVRAQAEVHDWEGAVDGVGRLLLDAGKITAAYISGMKRVLTEMGPYAVIAPGIVLLHARPEDGVLEPCLGLMTLKQGVPFGHSENDPVDLVFALGAVDKQAHIEALRALAERLGEPAFLELLRAAQTDGQLAAAFGPGN
jgi:mannitol/fructose-specific phosphotransferase system IIA component (Ntr-type)